MSNTQLAFLDKDLVPRRDLLQKTIDELGFDLQLDPEFTPFDDEGFSPCVLQGESDVGFEIYYEPSEDIVADDEELKAIANGKNLCISMCWGGSLKDYACVMIVSSALAKEFGAIISYQGDEPEPLEKIISDTHDIIKEAELEEKRSLEAKEVTERLKQDGNLKAFGQKLLDELSGTTITDIAIYTGLDIRTSNGNSLRSKAFMLLTETGEKVDLTQYSRIRARQIALMHQSGGDINPKQQAELVELERKTEPAMEADEKAMERFATILEWWPEQLHIESVTWPQSNTLKITFSNVPSAHIELWAFDSMLSDISIRSELLEFKITPDGCEIVG